MSRSFVRLMAGFALVAVPMVSVQAQGCTINGGGTCNVLRDATFSIPTLAYMEITNQNAIAIATPNNGDWGQFLTNNTPVTTYTPAPMVIRANRTYGVSLAASPVQGGNRPLSAHGFKFDADCSDPANYTTLTTGAQTLIGVGAPAASNNAGNLCISSAFDPTDFAGSLAQGTYTIPLTLTITAP